MGKGNIVLYQLILVFIIAAMKNGYVMFVKRLVDMGLYIGFYSTVKNAMKIYVTAALEVRNIIFMNMVWYLVNALIVVEKLLSLIVLIVVVSFLEKLITHVIVPIAFTTYVQTVFKLFPLITHHIRNIHCIRLILSRHIHNQKGRGIVINALQIIPNKNLYN